MSSQKEIVFIINPVAGRQKYSNIEKLIIENLSKYWKPVFVETKHRGHARQIALSEGIKFVYIGNVPGMNAENTYCPSCKKLLIDRRGYNIMVNNIVNNKCKFCGENIPGVWK